MQYYQIQVNTDSSAGFKAVAEKLVSEEQKEMIMNMGEALRQEGRQEGQQEGIYTVAKNMIKQGLSVELIHQVTDLSIATIQALVRAQSESSTH